MIASLGRVLTKVFTKTAPDPFVIAVGLTLLAAILALVFGTYPGATTSAEKLNAMIDAWRGSDGLWKFLAFGMQMSLILVTGHALAASKPIRLLIGRLAGLPSSAPAAAALVGLVAAIFGLINWGLGLIVGALFAREVARVCATKNISVHGPLLAAAGYMGLLVWHGGFSGSAPLKMTTEAQARDVLPASVFESLETGAVPLSDTLLSPMNLFISGGLLIIIPIVLWLLTPKHDNEITPMPLDDDATEIEHIAGEVSGFPDWIERSPIVVWALALMLVYAFVRFSTKDGFMSLGPNEVNIAMLALGLIMHGSVRSYMSAAEDGARGCAGIILQFPLYAGIMGMLASSGLINDFSRFMASVANETTAPVLTLASAAIVNVFVPSGGGQWGIQGPIALQTGAEAGVAPAKMIMAVAYGDQLTNMLQPFWALPLLAITRVKAREIVGYTAVVMIVAALWMVVGLLVF
ncbi:MAG: short-chain fatty acid transporter [Phycisphaerales bacterium]|nr:short-chain fatty acid transporter [Phycisphaerales bacterium]